MDKKDNSYYDLEALKRFVDGVEKNQQESHKLFIQEQYKRFLEGKLSGQIEKANEQELSLCKEIANADILSVCRALSALIYTGADLKKEFGIRKKSTSTSARLGKTIHDPEFAVLLSLEGNEITHTEAVKYLAVNFCVEKTAAEKFIREHREAAKKLIESFELSAPSNLKPYKSRAELFPDH